MQEAYRALLSTHVLLGCVALAAFWIALALPKGSARSRRFAAELKRRLGV